MSSLAPIQSMPPEIALNILGYLPPKDLGRISCVSREWRALASDASLWNAFDLQKLFPKLNVIDGAVWKTHADYLTALRLELDDEPTTDKRTAIAVLTRLFATWEIEGDAGITLLTIPKKLTLNKLGRLAKTPKQGNAIKFGRIWASISEVLGNEPVDKTCKIAISNSVLNGSRNLTITAQQELVNNHGGEMPGIIHAAALAFLTFISSREQPPTRLYGDEPRTYTRCCEHINNYPLIVGDFTQDGPRLDNDHLFSMGLPVDMQSSVDYIGVGIMHKF